MLSGNVQGDSGGPLACQDQQGTWTVIGVTSFGFGYCSSSYDARVPSMVNWIQPTINDNSWWTTTEKDHNVALVRRSFQYRRFVAMWMCREITELETEYHVVTVLVWYDACVYNNRILQNIFHTEYFPYGLTIYYTEWRPPSQEHIVKWWHATEWNYIQCCHTAISTENTSTVEPFLPSPCSSHENNSSFHKF